jgi:hypothetical protein
MSGRFFSTHPTERAPKAPPWKLFGAEVFLIEVKSKVIYRVRENGEKIEKKTRNSPKKK